MIKMTNDKSSRYYGLVTKRKVCPIPRTEIKYQLISLKTRFISHYCAINVMKFPHTSCLGEKITVNPDWGKTDIP